MPLGQTASVFVCVFKVCMCSIAALMSDSFAEMLLLLSWMKGNMQGGVVCVCVGGGVMISDSVFTLCLNT